MESAAALGIRGLTVRYGDAVAVDDLSLTIPRGQTVALLGANGAGKSTTVNAVLGLLRPAAGQVRVFGRSPADAVRAGSVGAMLQHGGLPSEARVGEVLDLVRRSFPTAWPLDDLVVTAGIEGLLGRSVDALSGGQRQRVLLSLALAGAPPLLLLDEPTSAMDVEGRRAFWTTMRGLAGRGHTVVFATHHLDEADAVADRVVVVAEGRVVADGTTAEIKTGVGGRTVSFTADPARRLDDLPAVTAVTRRGATVTLATTDADATLRALLAEGGLPDLEVRGATLEDAVLSLIATRRPTPIGVPR
ncbi:ATP-binding cassette domain-containing protein [Blastococcus saxobsidens]|uniref:ATP-binding cassette domain-containing protein n=1 Tax=Blastococcus saxobsidens TaxID=138336 RepID=A0A6L9W5D6_9ACTN|nr:ATP-binding cassette domain-containing protein [Blastococcus saxobsidens]NEK86650.1 ATP-binding cassette domain-containing protein [Blastococcus saxobsidens]